MTHDDVMLAAQAFFLNAEKLDKSNFAAENASEQQDKQLREGDNFFKMAAKAVNRGN